MKTFGEFMTKTDRDNRSHLRILGHILKKAKFKVKAFLDDSNDPYIYVMKPIDIDEIIKDIEFGGIRIYSRGKDIICFRCQMKSETEPFGETYNIDVKGMYRDMIDEDMEKVPYRIIYYIINEIKNFFVASAKAKNALGEQPDSSMGAISSTIGTDYANTATSNDSSRRS